ncbi:uncharacterized protein ATC70_009897 [Mucor velutinosus]|uniref:Caprin-1 dimerization domain-containing protein n=1 Tax=Mucor velutinosus TaxID=708070 RepID=A0AAN7DRL9_9FUNG|nr:hypothetical protein ATC70_009897 [Mucor velutinosus]
MVKSKSSRKPNNKKKTNNNMIHPHIELIQAEICTLAEEIEHIEAIQKERELDAAEQLQKDIATACLQKYQATLAKLNDPPMVSKVRSYQDAYNTKKNEAQILFLLQFFYIVRLGQLGLFDVIEMEASPKTMLNAITDVCDRLIGASVYYATEPSSAIKTQKRKQVADILKKFDTSSEDVIFENISFKDIKDLIQHIWDNTVNEARVLENTLIDESAATEWAVIQFENMVQNGEIIPEVGSEHNDGVEQQPASETKAEASQQGPAHQASNEPVDQKPSAEIQSSPTADELNAKDNNEASAVSEWDKKDVSETSAANDWSKTQVLEAPVVDEWSKNGNVGSGTSAWEEKEKSETRAVSKEWTETSHHRKSSRSSAKSSWKSNNRFSTEPKEPADWNVNESRGWSNVVDNAVKADTWDNVETSATNDDADNNWASTPDEQQQQKPTETDVQQQLQPHQQASTLPLSPRLIDTKEQQQESYNSETNDNWRRRGIEDINNSRGRGSSYRGGYRGSSRGGKFRGGGSGGGRSRSVGGGFRGRGRGRGRAADFDSEGHHHSGPSQ